MYNKGNCTQVSTFLFIATFFCVAATELQLRRDSCKKAWQEKKQDWKVFQTRSCVERITILQNGIYGIYGVYGFYVLYCLFALNPRQDKTTRQDNLALLITKLKKIVVKMQVHQIEHANSKNTSLHCGSAKLRQYQTNFLPTFGLVLSPIILLLKNSCSFLFKRLGEPGRYILPIKMMTDNEILIKGNAIES
jgi:hypothetical protein